MATLSLSIVSSLFTTYLLNTAPASSCTTRCGTTWLDANTQCGACCPSGLDGDCPTNNYCYADLDPVPCQPSCGGIRCGTTWANANTQCGLCCTLTADCPTNNDCYADLDTLPCASVTTSQPTTLPPTIATSAPIPTTAVPTPPPIDGNTIGNYRIATISGCGTGKYVSLTFDDGPAEANEATAQIISTLNTHGIKATFYVSPAANGDDSWGLSKRCVLIRNLTETGNEVQSHSWTHPDFTLLSDAQIKLELDTVRDWIVSCGGMAPTIFRPPFGSLQKAQAEYIVQDLRYIIGLWNMDSNDWRTPNDFGEISANINLDLYGGDSINLLMHDQNVYSVLEDVINLFNNGYQFITQSECYRRCDTMDADGVCNDMHGQELVILSSWREAPTAPTTAIPTIATHNPTETPSLLPTDSPTLKPTDIPSETPTKYPTQNPSLYPTLNPSKYPTLNPSKLPTISPSQNPSITPTLSPTDGPSFTGETRPPTSVSLTEYPTKYPSINQTQNPSKFPSQNPTESTSMIEVSVSDEEVTLMREDAVGYTFIGFVILTIVVVSICVMIFCMICKRKREKNAIASPNSVLSSSPTTQLQVFPHGSNMAMQMTVMNTSQRAISV